MKRAILIFQLVLLFITLSYSYSQSMWDSIPTGTTENLRNVYFINNQTGFICGYQGTLLKSTNAGTNWYKITTPTVSDLWGISFPNANTGYISGGAFEISRMIKTTNGGNNWVIIDLPISVKVLDVDFINENIGYAVGEINSIIKTTNGGTNWIIQKYGGSKNIYSIKVFSSQIAICCNNGGEIYKTTNGGTNWILKPSGTFDPLFDMDFINTMEGYIVSRYFILKTVNQGENWSYITTPGWNSFGIRFVSSNIGFIVGGSFNVNGNAKILITTDSGLNWIQESSGTYKSLIETTSNNNFVYAVGLDGICLRRDNPIGIQNISSEIPSGYLLEQNYPNPFNPLTNIKFDIPKTSEVKLIIYDILGKEITTLVNESLSAGVYAVDWDGGGYTSGVYFYKLEAGEFVDVKKMVMVK